MVAEPREEHRSRDTRKGDGVAARFRPLSGDGPDRPEPSSVPAFGTAPWGYKRAEVDAWMSWMAGLVEHGRKETLRADSAEATLKATLDQLEQLQSLETGDGWPDGAAAPHRSAAPVADPLPRRTTRPDTRETTREPVAAPTGVGPGSVSDDGRNGQAPTAPDRDPDRPEMARLHVVETTLHEVMGLLNRLVESGRGADRSPDTR